MSYPAPRAAWWIVARREIMVRLTDKAFWISTIAVVVLMVIAFGVSALFAASQGRMQVGVADADGEAVVALAEQMTGQRVDSVLMPADELAGAVDDGAVDVGVVRTAEGWDVLVSSIETSTSGIDQAIGAYMMATNAQELGVDPAALQAGSQINHRMVGEQQTDEAAIALVTGMIFSILFFMSAMTYGVQIAQSVAEEKESRIIEILSAAIPARQLLIGKTLGNTIMALGQLLVFVGLGIGGVMLTDFSQVLPLLLPNVGWFVLFFLVGFAALSTLWAAAGAMANRVQDVSQTMMPLLMVLMIVYLAGFFARGTLAQWLSYIPVVSSVIMPQRLLSGQATWLDAVIALVVCLLFMVVAIRVGEYIYRRGLLKTSATMKWKELVGKG